MALNLQAMKAQFPDPFRKGIVDLLWQNARVMRYLNFIQNAGLSYAYAANAKLPGVGFRALNSTFTATSGVTNPKAEPLSILGGKIQTDTVQISLKGDAARTNQITRQLIAAAKFFDKCFFKGDPTDQTNFGVNAFMGLQKRLAGNQLVVNSTNGAVLDGDQLIVTLGRVQGPDGEKVVFMNQAARIQLEKWATETTSLNRMQYLQYVGEGPNRRMYFHGAPIEEVFYDETETAILGFTEKCGTSAVTTSAYVVRFGGSVDEQDVQGLSGLPGDIQARGPFDLGEYVLDVVQMVAGIGIFGGYSAARLQGITAT